MHGILTTACMHMYVLATYIQDQVKSLEAQVSSAMKEAEARAVEAAKAQAESAVTTSELLAMQVGGGKSLA
jgi:hypothetical protein